MLARPVKLKVKARYEYMIGVEGAQAGTEGALVRYLKYEYLTCTLVMLVAGQRVPGSRGPKEPAWRSRVHPPTEVDSM